MPNTVLITGCSPSGIGTATEFHLRGHRVFVSGRSRPSLAHFRDLRIETLVQDVASSASIETVKTGSVRSGTFDNAPHMVLPEGSLYQAAKEWIEGRHMLDIKNFIDADDFAKRVVGGLLRPSVRHCHA